MSDDKRKACPYCGRLLVKYGTDDVVGEQEYSEVTDEMVCRSCAQRLRDEQQQRKIRLFEESPQEFIHKYGLQEFQRFQDEVAP